METKFTKGPWVAMENGWVEAGGGHPVCMINDSGLSGSTFKEDIPNAHLIAAAPDLYEALVDMVDAVEYLMNDGEGNKETLAALAALAKARGECK